MIASEVLDQWQGRETVPLPEVARAVGMPRSTRDFAVRQGFIRPLGEGGRGKTMVLPWDEVVLIVAAAVLSAAAGVAITTIIRALRVSGATVAGSTIVIPAGLA
jgi:hypothetical protein